MICRVMFQARLGDLQCMLAFLYIHFTICLYYSLAAILHSPGQMLYLIVYLAGAG